MADDTTPGGGGPPAVKVEPGVWFWCSCGRSSHAPFCDGSHKGTGRQPVRVEVTEGGMVRWCRCGRTGSPPFCDGSHGNPAPPLDKRPAAG